MTATQIRIQKVSLIFRTLFQILLVAVPIVHILAWVHAPQAIDVSGKFGFIVSVVPKGVIVLHPLSISTKIYGFLVGAIPLIMIEFILYYLIRLFKLYAGGEIFSALNVNYIKKIGYFMLLVQIASIISNGILSFILTWGNPHGHRYIILTIQGLNITVILTAFLIILISWIMAEGCRLREEQQLTI